MRYAKRKLVVVMLLAVVAPAAWVQADNGGGGSEAVVETTPYSVNLRARSTPTDEVMAILGKPHTPDARQLEFTGEFDAGVRTSVKCGQLRVDLNFSAMAEDALAVFNQLDEAVTSLLLAAPYLIACQASPSVCAELKNINYQINERLKGLLDVCQSMDNFIDRQSDKERVGRANAWQQCVTENARMGQAAAQKLCNETDNPLLYTDIAQGWLKKTKVNIDQEVVKQLLTATGDFQDGSPHTYNFLTSILGELKLEKDGTVIPLFPPGVRPTTAATLANGVAGAAITLACNQSALDLAAQGRGTVDWQAEAQTIMWRMDLNNIVKEQITQRDVVNLWTLDMNDRLLACNALGRALARATLKRLADEGESIMVHTLQNQALDDDIRRLYVRRSSIFADLRVQQFDGSQHTVPELVLIIAKMAERVRETSRLVGAAGSRGQTRQTEEFRRPGCVGDATTCARTECEGVDSCKKDP